jgi:hypothetical protein
MINAITGRHIYADYFTTADRIYSFVNFAERVDRRIHSQWIESQSIKDLRAYCDRLTASLDERKPPSYLFSTPPKMNTKSGVVQYVYDLYNCYRFKP